MAFWRTGRPRAILPVMHASRIATVALVAVSLLLVGCESNNTAATGTINTGDWLQLVFTTFRGWFITYTSSTFPVGAYELEISVLRSLPHTSSCACSL